MVLVYSPLVFVCRKYEEIYPPEVGEFVYITDETYTKDQVIRMETLILKVLSFDIAVPTANIFAQRFLQQLGFTDTDKVHCLAMVRVTTSVRVISEIVTSSFFFLRRCSDLSSISLTRVTQTLNLLSPFVVFLLDFLLKAFCDSYLLGFQYLVELSMLDGETFLRFLPSVIGASAVCLASHTLGLEAWVSCHASLCFLSGRPSFFRRTVKTKLFILRV